MLQVGQLLAYKERLYQILDFNRIANQALVYNHNNSSYYFYDIKDLEILSKPTEALILLYKKDVPYQELYLEYQKSMEPQFKREYQGMMTRSLGVQPTMKIFWSDDD